MYAVLSGFRKLFIFKSIPLLQKIQYLQYIQYLKTFVLIQIFLKVLNNLLLNDGIRKGYPNGLTITLLESMIQSVV